MPVPSPTRAVYPELPDGFDGGSRPAGQKRRGERDGNADDLFAPGHAVSISRATRWEDRVAASIPPAPWSA